MKFKKLVKIQVLFIVFTCMMYSVQAQNKMTPELLWKLNRVSAVGLSTDSKWVVYGVTSFDITTNKRTTNYYKVPIIGGEPIEAKNYNNIVADKNLSPNKKYKLSVEEIKVKNVIGTDFYPNLSLSDVYIYDNLNYRHWDTWEDGKFSHIFVHQITEGKVDSTGLDIMPEEPYDCPQKPFGGDEDYTWNPEGTKIVYVSKKKYGTAYAVSTNTDLYLYDIATKTTSNLTEANKGYDTQPLYSSKGILGWLQMDMEGNEADKNDIIVAVNGETINLTKDWDGTVSNFVWSIDASKIYFNAPINGTVQLFEVDLPKKGVITPVKQITNGQFDVQSMVGQLETRMIVTRTDMNHAPEIYSIDLKNGEMTQLTHVNNSFYSTLQLSDVKKRMVTTTDGTQMLTWVIYPPDFDPNKTYPTLLYCQGGPQSALSQFYSFRWNFQLMAAQGYIIVAPSRRGMPGFGVKWNDQISGDYGGQNMKDYLSAIDDVCKEPYVDKNRLGCVGASYGGYSAFYLAGIHENRFKTFIAHDGIFNTRSMYGTTEEVFFVHHDLGGAYWDDEVRKNYVDFNPIEKVDQWNTPILIIQGGKDYRVPDGQALGAFQAAQLRGIKSKLLYFPNENHWITSPQNGLVWQHEFYKWLSETLNIKEASAQ